MRDELLSSWQLQGVIRTLENVLAGSYGNYQHQSRTKKGRFNYIPLELDYFWRQIGVAAKQLKVGYNRPKFVDVGCGVGTKLLLAQKAGFDAYGIEVNPEYAKVAKKVLGYRPVNTAGFIKCDRIIEADALKQKYTDFDVIYFYRPLADNQLEAKLEKRIITTAKPGAIILANYKTTELPAMQALWNESGLVKPIADDAICYQRV